MGITADSRFELAAATTLPAGVTLDRLDRRRSLVQQRDQGRRDLGRSAAGRGLDRYRQSCIGSPRSRTRRKLNHRSQSC